MKRCIKNDKQKRTKGRRRRKGRGGGGRSVCGGLDQEYWWGPTVIQRCKSGRSHCGCQITSTPQQEIWDRAWGEKGQDYKFSSFRTPTRTEVENNPQPYPVRGNSLSHWWQIGCHFQKPLKTKGLCPIRAKPRVNPSLHRAHSRLQF